MTLGKQRYFLILEWYSKGRRILGNFVTQLRSSLTKSEHKCPEIHAVHRVPAEVARLTKDLLNRVRSLQRRIIRTLHTTHDIINRFATLFQIAIQTAEKRSSCWVQIGIVSWGYGCGQYKRINGILRQIPGYYTYVSPFMSWINTTMNDN